MSNSTPQTMSQFSMPSLILRAEGLVLFVGAVILYTHLQFSGWALLLLLFSLDVFMVGYLKNPRVGSVVYNIGHTDIAPIVLALVSLSLNWSVGLQFALIWFAHIGLDRLMGYGLKYPTVFQDTHFQRL